MNESSKVVSWRRALLLLAIVGCVISLQACATRAPAQYKVYFCNMESAMVSDVRINYGGALWAIPPLPALAKGGDERCLGGYAITTMAALPEGMVLKWVLEGRRYEVGLPIKSRLNGIYPTSGIQVVFQNNRVDVFEYVYPASNHLVRLRIYPPVAPKSAPGTKKPLQVTGWSDDLKSSSTKVTSKKDYLVSAILREGVDGFTIKLVHLVQSADSRDEVTGIFTRLAFEQYPGHAVAKTLIAEISLPTGPCAKDKQAVPETAYAVSAVMRKGTDGLDIMLLNGWMSGNNADDALRRALQEAATKYPNYAAIKTLVTELKVAQPTCSAPSPMRGHWREA